MSKYWLLDFNSILDEHLSTPQVKNLTRDSGTTASTRSEELSSYSFYDSIFDDGGGHYSNMKSTHIIYNLKKDDYDYHYDDISDYTTTTISRDLSTSFNGGRYCIMMESNDDRSAMYDFFDENAAIRDKNYGFGVTTRSGWGHWLQFLRPQSYAFSFEEQTKPTDGFTDSQYWGFKDFKIIAQTDSNNKTQNVFFMIDSKVIFEFPIDSTNYFYVLNTKSWWDEITETKFKNTLGIQTFYIKPESAGYSTYEDFIRPTCIEFSDDNGTTWKKIGGSFPSRKKPDGNVVSTTDYDNTVAANNLRYDNNQQSLDRDKLIYANAERYREKLNEWGMPWTNTSNPPTTSVGVDDYITVFRNSAPILLYSMVKGNGRENLVVIKNHYIDVYGIPKNATHIKIWSNSDRQRWGLEINGSHIGDFDMWDPYYSMKEASLDGVTLNGKEDFWSNEATTGMQSGYNPTSFNGTPVFYNNSIYFFGRRESSTNYAEMWKLNIETNTWSKLTTTGTIAATHGHSTILYNDCLYIFGGKNNSDNYTNDTYKFDLSTDTFSQITTLGTAPTVRYEHAACLNSTEMIISGGATTGGGRISSTFKLDLTTDIWTEISTTGSDMAKRNGHTIFTYNSKLYIIGGLSDVTDGANGNISDNVYTLNLTTNVWNHLTTLGSFTGSYYASTILIGDNLLIFGGWTSTNTTGLNKFYNFSLTNNIFSEITVVEGILTTDWGTLVVFDSVNWKIHYYGGNEGNNQQKLYTYNFAYINSSLGGSNTYIGTLDYTIYRELHDKSSMKIISSAGNKIVLNQYSSYNDKIKYTLNIGTYYITNIPNSHPIALLNNGIEDKISYTGLITKKTNKIVSGTTADSTYDFYTGNITITVHDNFSECSIYCYHHGYMGGENLLKFDSNIINKNSDTIEYGIYNTYNAWLMLKTDGSVYGWGDDSYGATGRYKTKVQNVSRIFQTKDSFCALRKDNVAIPIGGNNDVGNGYNDSISSNYSIMSELTNVREIFQANDTFFALKYDGTGVLWGSNSDHRIGYMDISNNLTDIIDVVSNYYSFAVLKNDGSVITWGNTGNGGDSSSVQNELTNIKIIFPNQHAFAAVKYDGSVITWGSSSYGGDSSSVENDLVNIIHIVGNRYGFVAINKDNKIAATWGHSSYGHNLSPLSNSDKEDVKEIHGWNYGYVLINHWDKAIYWGDNGSYYGSVENVLKVAVCEYSLAILKTDGTVVVVGHGTYGGNPSDEIKSQLTNVVDIFSFGGYSHVALKNDNSIVVWGREDSDYPNNMDEVYIAGTTDPVENANIDIFDVWPGYWNTYLEKLNGDFVRIGQNAYAAENYSVNYEQTHKIGSKYNRYSRARKHIFSSDVLAFWNISYPHTKFTQKLFQKYTIPQIKKDFHRLNYSDSSYNLFNNCFTNNILDESIKIFIIDELNNETNIILKNEKRKIFMQLLLKNNNKNNLLFSKTDLAFDDIVSKKNIEVFDSGSIIDLTNRNEEIGIYLNLDKNEHVIIKSENGQFIFFRDVEAVEKYTIIEYIDSLNNIIMKPIYYCKNFNFQNNSGFFEKDDIFQIDQYNFKVGSLIDVSDIRKLTGVKIKNVFANDGAFVSLKNNGYIDCWGKANYGGTPPTDISNVKDIFTTPDTFTALLNNDSIITWGNTPNGEIIIKPNQNLKRTYLLQRVNSLSGNINTVMNNNKKTLMNYNYKTNSINIPTKLLTDEKIIDFINYFSSEDYTIVQNIEIINNEIEKTKLEPFLINNNIVRQLFLDALFLNNGETNIILDCERLDLQNKILKEKVNILEQNKVVMNVKKNSPQINKDMGVCSNLSDLSDNVVVEMDNNISFKVLRTTNNTSIGKYIIRLISGSITVHGRHSGTLNNVNEELGLYEDDDDIYINNVSFFFGGFGTNGINTAENQRYNNITSHSNCIAYLDASGGIQLIGTTASEGNSLSDSSHGVVSRSGKNFDTTKDVVHITTNGTGFCALTQNGEVFSWGDSTYNSMTGQSSWQEDITHLNNNVIQIYSNQYFNVALKENREIIVWGYIKTKNGSPYIYTYDGSISSTYINNNYKEPILSPIKNVHEIILNQQACAVITIDRKLVTFGSKKYGGDYLDETYGIYSTKHSIEGKTQLSSILTNVKKVVDFTYGFAALDYDGCVYVWGNQAMANRDISLNSGVFDIEGYGSGFLARWEDSVKVYGYFNHYHPTGFSNIEQDVSQNCTFVANGYSCAFHRKSDNMVFVCGSTGYGGNLSSTVYKYEDRQDVVSNYQLKNVSKLYTAYHGFGVIKTDGSAEFWGANNTNRTNYAKNAYGGNLDSHVKKLFNNGYAWCALKEDETIVSFRNGQETENYYNYGSDFSDDIHGINSIKFGGNGAGGTKKGSYYDNQKIGFVKNVVPLRTEGFMAHINNNGVHSMIFWGWDNINSYPLTTDDFEKFKNPSKTSNMGLVNTNYQAGYHHTDKYNKSVDNNIDFPYKKTIKVTVQNINGENKFVFDNDVSNNPLEDKSFNYVFDLTDTSLTNHPFKIVSNPYTNNSIWKKYGSQGSPNSGYDAILNNKYNIIKCETHGVNMGSLYNDPNIITDISEGEIVETLYNTSTKTTIGNYTVINYDNSIPDNSLNIITFTNYDEISSIFNLISKVIAIRLDYIASNRNVLSITNSDLNFNDSILLYNNVLIFDYNTTISFNLFSELNSFYYGNLIEKNNKITIVISSSKQFSIEKISDIDSTDKYKINFITGIIEFRTDATNYNITNGYLIADNNTSYNENSYYFSNNDTFFIDDIKFEFVNNGFITSGRKTLYKEILITKDSNGVYLFNNKYLKPSFEYGINYKLIDNISINKNYPLYVTKNTF